MWFFCLCTCSYDIKLHFRNEVHRPVHLTNDGKSHLLLPGSTRSFYTKNHSAWVATDEYDNVLLRYITDDVLMNPNQSGESEGEFVDCSIDSPILEHPNGNTPTFFRSDVEREVSLYWWNGTCERFLCSMYPRERVHVVASHGHAFRTRDPHDLRTLISQKVLKDIVIRDESEEYLENDISKLETERLRLLTSLAAALSRISVMHPPHTYDERSNTSTGESRFFDERNVRKCHTDARRW